MNTITFFGNTDVGRIRTNNEDAFIAQYLWDDKSILAVAIDGVGGYEGGEVASSLAQKCIIEYLESYSNGERLELLKQAVIFANNRIYSERKNLPQYGNMSCVLTAILIETENKIIHMAHIGDTRLYQYADNTLTKLSHDHSLVGYREEIGELTEEEAMNHPQRNVISRDVGSQYLESSGKEYIEFATFPLLPNSSLLLCSDGLSDMVTAEQIKCILEQDLPVQEKVNDLIALANSAGGKDNVTIVLIESLDSDDTPQEANIIQIQSAVDIKKETMIDVHTNSHKMESSFLRVIIVLFISVSLFVLGYILGGFTGHRLFPAKFSHITPIADSLEIEGLKKDTTELHSVLIEEETLIDSLQNTISHAGY